jgi:hypothetical protein
VSDITVFVPREIALAILHLVRTVPAGPARISVELTEDQENDPLLRWESDELLADISKEVSAAEENGRAVLLEILSAAAEARPSLISRTDVQQASALLNFYAVAVHRSTDPVDVFAGLCARQLSLELALVLAPDLTEAVHQLVYRPSPTRRLLQNP